MVMFIKTDSLGNLVWKKVYGSGFVTLSIKEIQVLNNGYIAAGGLGLQNSADAYLMRLDQNGDTLWTKKYGGNKTDFFYSIDMVGIQGYVLGGTSTSYNINNKPETYLIKTDANGNELWNRTYSGYDFDVGRTVRYRTGLGIVIAGYSDSIAGNDIKAKVRFVNEAGLLIKETSYLPNITNCTLAVFNSAGLTSDGGFIFAGYNEINTFLSMYLVKTDSLLFSNPIGIISSHSNTPENFILYQNFPNPFNPSTNIIVEIKRKETVEIVVYDVLGKMVTKLFSGDLNIGKHNFTFKPEAFKLSSGVFYYSIYSNKKNDLKSIKKMIYLK